MEDRDADEDYGRIIPQIPEMQIRICKAERMSVGTSSPAARSMGEGEEPKKHVDESAESLIIIIQPIFTIHLRSIGRMDGLWRRLVVFAVIVGEWQSGIRYLGSRGRKGEARKMCL